MQELQVDYEAEGVVTRFDPDQRFALVRCTDGATEDRICVDRKCLKKSSVDELATGMRVKCKVAQKKKGPWAKRIVILS